MSSLLFPGEGLNDRVVVHPVVLFSVVDHWNRRGEVHERVIGALLGTVQDNVVEINNSFPVRHSESGDEVTVDAEYFTAMLQLHRQQQNRKPAALSSKDDSGRIPPKEDDVVGWYATGDSIASSIAFASFFHQRSVGARPVHLLVDSTLEHGGFNPQGYAVRLVPLDPHWAGFQFSPLPTSVVGSGVEQIGLDALLKYEGRVLHSSTETPDFVSDLQSMARSVSELLISLSEVEGYVESVTEGRRVADPRVGRALLDVITSVDTLSEKELDSVLSARVQDMLMLHYLGDIAKAQALIAERLQKLCT